MLNGTWKLRSSWICDGYKVAIAILMHLPNTLWVWIRQERQSVLLT